MPQIFTGKVVIPGEQLPQYLDAMAETEEARAPESAHRSGGCVVSRSTVKQPSALVPLAMSCAALAIVLGHMPMSGVGREADEGAGAGTGAASALVPRPI